MTDRELMQMALDALEEIIAGCGFLKEEQDTPEDSKKLATLVHEDCSTISDALRERLAQPEYDFECPRCGHCCQQREWVGLTDEELEEAETGCWYMGNFYHSIYAQNIEDKLKEKNS
jgi:hypothetical protein